MEGEGEADGGDRRQKVGTGGRGWGQEAEGGDRRSGRALMTFKCHFNKSLCFLSMVRYHKLLKHVYNIFLEGFTYDNHPTVKKGEMLLPISLIPFRNGVEPRMGVMVDRYT